MREDEHGLLLHTSGVPMKLVYQLSEELRADPDYAVSVQALTLDETRPLMGLKGRHGLFASPEWWESIKQGKMPMLRVSGMIRRVYVAGQDVSDVNNTVDLVLGDGCVRAVGIYTNNASDVERFRVGHRVDVVYALDELKQQPGSDGRTAYSDVALEMAVSLRPVEIEPGRCHR